MLHYRYEGNGMNPHRSNSWITPSYVQRTKTLLLYNRKQQMATACEAKLSAFLYIPLVLKDVRKLNAADLDRFSN